jgi:ligand-binding SRPBCC domain-containing protein
MYWLRTEITIDSPIDTTFELFCDAANLEKLTPPELRFEIISPLPIEMKRGAEIEYRIRLFGIPFSWHTEITVWEPGFRFVDEQVAGPFRKWVHEHRFEPVGDSSTRIRDEVAYNLPLEPVGRLAHPLVRSRLNRIFAFREREVRRILSGSRTRGAIHVSKLNSMPPITREVSF